MAITRLRGGGQITDGTIPYADIQNVTANTILGNNTAGATSIQEIALASSQLLGRGTTGNITAITAGTGLAFSGTSIAVSANLASLSGLTYSSASFVKMTAAGTFTLDTATYIATGGQAGSVANSLILKADSGTTEGTDLYTYNGSAAKTLNVIGTGLITITKAAGSWTIATTATANTGTVTSVGGTGTVSGISLSGTVTTSGNLTLSGTLSVTPSNFATQTANTVLAGPTTGVAATPTFRTLVAADIPALSYVTSVSGTGTVSGLTLTGTVTGSGNLTLGGTLSLTSGNVTTALGYTPYNATNPSGYITGVAWNDVTSKPSNIFYYEGWVNNPGYDANTIAENRSGFTYSNNAPNGGPIVHFAASGYGLQFNASYGGGGGSIAYRTRNGDTSSWNSWYTIVHNNNFSTYLSGETLQAVMDRGASSTTYMTLTGGGSFSGNQYKFYSNTSAVYLKDTNSPGLQAFSTNNGAAYMSFHKNGTYAVNFGLDPDTVLRIGGWSLGANNIWSLTMGGTMTVSGDIIAFGSPSDARYKTIKEVVPDALKKVQKLNGYRFDWNQPMDTFDLKEDIGVIAQEVAEVIPELARTNADGYMSVRYQGLTAVLIEAVKEQQRQIEALKKQIDEINK